MEPSTSPLRERRIANATANRTMWESYRTNSENRREKWATTQNQLDGAAPMSNLALVNTGQGWRCNVNFRDAASTLEQVLVSYWRLLHDSTNLAAVTVQTPDDPNAERWSQLFQTNFNRFNEDWGADYVRNYLLFSLNHVTFGMGLCFWSDKDTPRWEALRVGEVEVSAKAKASVEKLKCIMVRQELDFEDLWELIRTPEKKAFSEKAGWNTQEIEKLLVNELSNRQGDKGLPISEGEALELQRSMRNNSYGVTSQKDPLKIVHTFIVDFDGKISWYSFAEKLEHNEEFLFADESDGRSTKMQERLAAVFFDAGNGDWWGTKGFGLKNFQLSSVLNRLKSRAVDRTLIDGLNFRDMSEGMRETVPIVNVGPFNFLPKDVEQLPQYPSGRSILETISMVESNADQNNARYRDQSQQISQAGTATEANLLAGIQQQVDVANATLYLRQVAQNIFSEQFRRLRARGNTSEDAVKFKKRCVEEGKMPEETFHSAEISVITGASPGAANLQLQAQYAIEGLNLPEGNKRWFQETWVAARFGAGAVSKALLPVDATNEIRSVRLALMENSDMGEGNPLPVDPQDNHAAHIPSHLTPLEMLVAQYAQSGQLNPQALVALQFGVPHLQSHLDFLKNDKTQEALYRDAWPRFTSVASSAEGMFTLMEKMHNQAQQGTARVGAGAASGSGQSFSPAAEVGAGTPQ